MKFKDMLFRAVAAGVVITAAATSAHADFTGGAGRILNVNSFGTDATLANFNNAGSNAFTFTTTSGPLNFTTGDNTPGGFLGTGGGTCTNVVAGACAANLSRSNGNSSQNYSTIFRFDGTFSGAGTYNEMITHDDGISFYVDGTLVSPVGAASQTFPAPVSFNFTVGSGTHTIALYYDECCSPPAVLNASLPTLISTPEPASIALLGTVVFGVGTMLRRKYRSAAV